MLRTALVTFAVTFGVIFVAELGDKSQLLVMTLATRLKPLPVLAGVLLATGILHGLAVGVGAAVGAALPTGPIRIAAGVLFCGFAAWTYFGTDDDDGDDPADTDQKNASAFLTAFFAFFLSEFGDKTQLASVTLASTQVDTNALIAVWLGATLGMFGADALAVGVGRFLRSRIPDTWIKIGSAALFGVFGVIMIIEGITGADWL